MKHIAPILLALALTACGDDTYNYTLPEEEAPQPPIVEPPPPPIVEKPVPPRRPGWDHE